MKTSDIIFNLGFSMILEHSRQVKCIPRKHKLQFECVQQPAKTSQLRK